MKQSMLLSILTLTSALYADGDLVAAAQKMDRQSQQDMMRNNNMMMNVVTLTSARPESDNGWYLFADALYWHVDIGSADWVNKIDNINATVENAKNHSLNFKWDWGFRVGIGANIDHDMWDTNFYYTWLFADNSNSAGVGPNGLIVDQMGIGLVNQSLTTGSTKWNLHFSMFDWELGRWHYVSKNLALRPHMGVKGGWINQKIHSNFSHPRTIAFHEKLENNFWGVGPSVGVNTMWVLGNAGSMMDHRFSLFGDFGGALLYGHFGITNRQQGVNAAGIPSVGVHQKGLSRNLATTMMQGLFGLSWDTSFNNDKAHFMLKVGYELQYWFRQNQLVKTNIQTGGLVTAQRVSDDLALQGVTAEFRFDF